MTKYYDRATAPLKFHKFFWYFSLPIGFLYTFYELVSDLLGMQSYHWIYTFNFVSYIIAMILDLVCFIGFFHWKAYAWYCLMVRFGFALANAFSILVISAVYSPDQVPQSVGQFIGVAAASVLIIIYYVKRKPLFIPGMAPPSPEIRPVCRSAPPSPNSGPRYCRNCGSSLTPGSSYCSRCGASQL